MKKVTYSKNAQDDLRKHKSIAARILDKVSSYAQNPNAFVNMVTQLKGDIVFAFVSVISG